MYVDRNSCSEVQSIRSLLFVLHLIRCSLLVARVAGTSCPGDPAGCLSPKSFNERSHQRRIVLPVEVGKLLQTRQTVVKRSGVTTFRSTIVHNVHGSSQRICREVNNVLARSTEGQRMDDVRWVCDRV
jgi:hypothetical protein